MILLLKVILKSKHQALDFIVDQIDRNKNLDPEFTIRYGQTRRSMIQPAVARYPCSLIVLRDRADESGTGFNKA